ncbi:hypothetical protein AHAS_Ahas13G0245800 [Arachis hypogaea]
MVKVGIIDPLKVIKIGEYVNMVKLFDPDLRILVGVEELVGVESVILLNMKCSIEDQRRCEAGAECQGSVWSAVSHIITGWLVNTGWSGGRYDYGSCIKLPYTRKIIDAIYSGSLLNAEYKKTEIFGFEIPIEVEGVPSEILDPINTVSSLC